MSSLDNALSGKRRIVPTAKNARWGFLLLLPVIAVAALYGRALERAYPALIFLLPYSGFLFFLLHATSLGILASRIPKGIGRPGEKPLLILASLLTPFFFLYIAIALIQLPIERVHILKYGLLGYLLAFSLRGKDGERRILLGFLIAGLVGTAEETVQLWIPERRFDAQDVLLNILSAAAGTWYAFVVDSVDRLLRGFSSPSLRDSSG